MFVKFYGIFYCLRCFLWYFLLFWMFVKFYGFFYFPGKTALHWAAAVNNVEAVVCLLQRGANRDAQDNRDQTPLFLAAKEGSFEACKSLLDHYANRDITDHMDHLPRDVADERRHQDIVKLLDEYRADSPGATGGYPPGATSMHYHGGAKKAKRKSKAAAVHTLKDPGGPLSPKGQIVKLPAVQKKKKKKAPAAAGSADSLESVTDLPPSYESACAHMSTPNLHSLGGAGALSDLDLAGLAGELGGAAGLYNDGNVKEHTTAMDCVKEENLSPEAWLDNVPSNNHHHLHHHQPQHNVPQHTPLGASAQSSSVLPPCISPPSTGSPYSNASPPSSLCYPTGPSPPTSSTMPPSSSSTATVSPPRRSLPLSPTHLQAMHQQAAAAGYTSYLTDAVASGGAGNNPMPNNSNHPQQQQTPSMSAIGPFCSKFRKELGNIAIIRSNFDRHSDRKQSFRRSIRLSRSVACFYLDKRLPEQ